MINWDLTLIQAKNEKEPLEKCTNNPNLSLILMGIKMQKIGGQTVVKMIKEFRLDLLFIAQSANTLKHLRKK